MSRKDGHLKNLWNQLPDKHLPKRTPTKRVPRKVDPTLKGDDLKLHEHHRLRKIKAVKSTVDTKLHPAVARRYKPKEAPNPYSQPQIRRKRRSSASKGGVAAPAPAGKERTPRPVSGRSTTEAKPAPRRAGAAPARALASRTKAPTTTRRQAEGQRGGAPSVARARGVPSRQSSAASARQPRTTARSKSSLEGEAGRQHTRRPLRSAPPAKPPVATSPPVIPVQAAWGVAAAPSRRLDKFDKMLHPKVVSDPRELLASPPRHGASPIRSNLGGEIELEVPQLKAAPMKAPPLRSPSPKAANLADRGTRSLVEDALAVDLVDPGTASPLPEAMLTERKDRSKLQAPQMAAAALQAAALALDAPAPTANTPSFAPTSAAPPLSPLPPPPPPDSALDGSAEYSLNGFEEDGDRAPSPIATMADVLRSTAGSDYLEDTFESEDDAGGVAVAAPVVPQLATSLPTPVYESDFEEDDD